MPTLRPFATPITIAPELRLLDGERQRPANGELAVDRRARLAAADRAANGLERALERQLVAGTDDALEAHVVDAGEEREPAAVRLLREHRDRARLGERLDHLHAGHDRVAGEVARAVLVGHALARDDARARIELDDLVQEQKGVPVREDLFDRLPTEGRRRGQGRLV